MADLRAPLLPLRLRLTFWYTASLCLVLLLFFAVFYIQLRRSLTAQIDLSLDIVATQALINVQAGDGRLAFRGLADNPAIVRQMRDDFLIINLLSPDGHLWDHLGEGDQMPISAPSPGYKTVFAAGEPRRVYNRPVTVDGASGWIQIIQDMDSVNEPLTSVRRQLLVALPVALLVAALGGYFLAARALRPVERITRTARAITAEDLRRRIDYAGPPDEIRHLAQTIDDMLARLEASFERERRFTADAAHELRTPLAALKGRIGVTLSRPRPPAAYVTALAEMEGQVDRLSRLSDDLLLMARLTAEGEIPAWEPILLPDFLPAVLDVVRPLAGNKGIELTLDAPAGLYVHGHLDWLMRLLLNLLDNAIKFTPAGGRVSLSARRGADAVEIVVSDTGAGIAPEHVPHLFERFYRVEGDRARAGGGGSGLGLALAQEIARLHDGHLSVFSELGRGSAFTLRLPDRPLHERDHMIASSFS